MDPLQYISEAPPLHAFVCRNDIEGAKAFIDSCGSSCHNDDLVDTYDYTALELAHFLGREHFALLFSGREPPVFKIVERGQHTVHRYTPAELLRVRGVIYTPTLYFTDLATWLEMLEEPPWIWTQSYLGREMRKRGEEYGARITSGWIANMTVVWLGEPIGYGVITNRNLAPGDYIGTYTGAVRRIKRSYPNLNAYCTHYPTRWWSHHYYVIDAQLHGNEMRYINHSDTPNLTAMWAVDRGLMHLLFFADEEIPRGEQLTIDYGADFWYSSS